MIFNYKIEDDMKYLVVLFILINTFCIAQNNSLRVIATEKAPAAIGPYSQAIVFGDFIFCSGQIALDPITSQIVGDDIESQTMQVFANIKAVLFSEGLSLDRVVKCTVFMKNLDDFAKMNQVYGKEFGMHRPARSTVQVTRLPKDVLIEIECIAVKDKDETDYKLIK
jgi:2-iminobutanoate/2-iminopropanoate deaminase